MSSLPALRYVDRSDDEMYKLLESDVERVFWNVADQYISGLMPQYKVGKYRVDFAIPGRRIVVELDGHDYHKTKEQRTNDASRERYLIARNWRVIRFTGSEIYKDTSGCIEQLLRIIIG